MADSQNLKIRIEADTSDAVKGLQSVDKAAQALDKELTETAKSVKDTESAFSALGNVTGLAIGALTGVVGAFLSVKAIKAGAEVADINGAFQKLAEGAGYSASVLKDKLAAATGETIRQVDLLKIANQGLQAGLKPETIEAAAKAARSYADAVGGDAAKELDLLIDGLAKGNDGFLKSRGIIIDNAAAFKTYAEANGIAVEKLNEVGKAEAIRAAATTALIEKTKTLGEVQNDTADSLDKVFTALSNTRDKILEAIGTNENLGKAFNEVAEAIKAIDAQAFIDNVVTPIVDGTGASIRALTDLGDNLKLLGAYLKNPFDGLEAAFGVVQQGKRTEANKKFNVSIVDLGKKLGEADDIIKGIGVGIDFTQKDFNKFKGSVDEVKAAIVKSGKPLSDYEKGFAEIDRRVKSLGNLYSGELTPRLDENATAFTRNIPKIKSAKDSTKELGSELYKLKDTFGAFNGPLDQFGNLVDTTLSGIEEEASKVSDSITSDFLKDLASSVSSEFNEIGKQLASGGFNFRQSLGNIGVSIGQSVGTAVGASLGGPVGAAAGSVIGGFVGEELNRAITTFGKDSRNTTITILNQLFGLGSGQIIDKFFGDRLFGNSAGTDAKKKADAFFAEAFDKNRLSVVVNGQLTQLSDLVFSGNQEGGLFSKLPAATQSAFAGIGTAFQGLLGVAQNLGVNIGNVFANNIGGDLNSLQLLVKATGVSFEELGKQVEQSFLKGELSALKAEEALIAIQTVAQDGIPGALGAVDEAFDNVFAAGSEGGAALVDALKDIGFEAKELGIKDLAGLKTKLLEFVASGKFTQEQVTQYFAALAKNGITSVDALKDATTSQLISIASALQQSGALKESNSLVENLNNLPSEKTIKINVDTRLVGDKVAAEVLNNSGINVGQQEGRA